MIERCTTINNIVIFREGVKKSQPSSYLDDACEENIDKWPFTPHKNVDVNLRNGLAILFLLK